jgi:glycosyltransferase involved in cell wall biosynthesis
MKLVFFTHPDFLESQSMPRFANMLKKGMIERGHRVEVWTAKPFFSHLPVPKSVKKWIGYIDQYLIFPLQAQKKIKKASIDTLYVFTDHALGPWIPLVNDKPHVVHCHDFLAQQSALNKFPENKTGWTGKKYQAFIRIGYRKAKNFISVSKKTKDDLHKFLGRIPETSEVVYNGLNQTFLKHDPNIAKLALEKQIGVDLSKGYILHVGGNQWYKNRTGVIAIYNAWRSQTQLDLPLVMIGQSPSSKLLAVHSKSLYKNSIYLVTNIDDSLIRMAYSGASLLLFPSIAEGFGWPIVEAMASGCPVITTSNAPMTEVAGDAAYFVPCKPYNNIEPTAWAAAGAKVLNTVLNLSLTERQILIDRGLLNAKRFDTKKALDNIEEIYLKIIDEFEEKI